MKELYTEVQDTYLMLPSVEGRGLFSNTSTACSCSFKRTVFASTSLEKKRSEEGEGEVQCGRPKKCNAALAPEEGDKYQAIKHQGTEQRHRGDGDWEFDV